jgi:sterol desaturase/sphingolipid hydroxylase (fatty acid hydroxylase superfamily)
MTTFEGFGTILVITIFTLEFIVAIILKLRSGLVKDMLVNLGIGLTTLATGLFMKGVSFAVFSIVYSFAFFKPASSPALWLIAFLCCDFVIYWYHFLGHKTKLFWAAHVTHHSSLHYNISVGFRVSFIHVFYRFLFWSPLCLFGIPPFMILFFDSLTTIHNILIHTERVRNLGILDRIFNTPSNHRVHHATNPQYMDKNMGGILIIFDHLFGTYAREKEQPVYGITKNIGSHNPATILLHEYKHIFRQLSQIEGWKEKLKYLFSPPC